MKFLESCCFGGLFSNTSMVQFAYSLASGTKGVEHENKKVETCDSPGGDWNPGWAGEPKIYHHISTIHV